MARPRRRRLVGDLASQLSGQVAFRQAQEAQLQAAAQAQQAAPQARTSAAAVQTPGGLEGTELLAPGVLEGEGPPPPEPVVEPVTPAAVEPHPAAGFEGVEPEFARRLNALFSASGGRVYAGQGFRSYEGQVAAWNAAVAKYGEAEAPNWAARPGTSNHGRGLAMDIKGDYDLAHQLAPQFGLVFPMGNEPWHIEPVGLRTDPSTPPEAYTSPGIKEKATITETIKTKDGDRDVNVEAMAALSAAVYDEAVAPVNFARHLGEQRSVDVPEGTPQVLEGEGPPPPEPVAEPGQEAAAAGGGDANTAGGVEDWITEALRISGKPESWRDPLRALVMRESGGNPRAQNNWDSNAKKGTPSKGLVQFIEPTFAAQHMPGYGDIWNPVHSLLAGIRRIDLTYGGNVNSVGYRKGGY